MTQVHALGSGITPPRTTRDVDLVVDIAIAPQRLAELAGQLRSIGFEPQVPDSRRGTLYKFLRGDDEIDVMVPDHLPQWMRPLRLMQRNAFEVDGGAQAVARREEFTVRGTTRTAQIGVPNIVGALVIKSAAHRADQRERKRHLDDGATLLAAISAVNELPLDPLSKNDRRRLGHLLDSLEDANDDSWLLLDDDERVRGRLNAKRLRMVLSR